MLVECPHNLQPTEDTQGAVEDSSGGYGVKMRTDHDRFEGVVRAGPPPVDVPDLIDSDRQPRFFEPAHHEAPGVTIAVAQRQAADTVETGGFVVVGANASKRLERVVQTFSVDREVDAHGFRAGKPGMPRFLRTICRYHIEGRTSRPRRVRLQRAE